MSDKRTTIDVPNVGALTVATHVDGDPYISGWIELGNIFEPHILRVLTRFLGPGDRFLDVGGNLGWFAMIGSRLVGDSGHVDAIEPDPDNYRLLVRNLRDNGCRNVRTWQGGAGEQSGCVALYRSEENRGDHRIAAVPIPGRKTVTVPIRSVDAHLLWNRRVDTALIDTQGSEVHIFRGMRKVLRRNPLMRIIFEYWPHGLENCGSTTLELAGIVKQHGWRLWLLDDGTREIAADDLVQLAKHDFTPASGRHADVVALSLRDEAAVEFMRHEENSHPLQSVCVPGEL